MKIKAIFLIFLIVVGIYPLSANRVINDSLNSQMPDTNNIDIAVQLNEDQIKDEENFDGMKVQKGDTTYITLGKKTIKIYEEDGETSVKIEEKKKKEREGYDYPGEKVKWKNFKGHWAGFGFGLNNYVNSDFSFDRSDEDQFMDLNPAKSWNFNLNFAQYSIGIGGDRFGITTGMGLEWCNYHFSDTNIIQKNNGIIESKGTPENTIRNKMQTTYLTIPLLFEFQFPNYVRENRAYLSVGVIAGIKLFSNTKIKYIRDGNKQKEKFKSDYYLNSIRYGLTARAGYKDMGFYFNYYLTPLFLDDHGPELYPLAAGLVLNF